MSRSKSSTRWLQEHFNDDYVKRAKQEGYRSRASYKLLEIQAKDHIFFSGAKVLDLGAAPGSFSQVAVKAVGASGLVIASDILPMLAIDGVTFIQGDFTEDKTYQQILAICNNAGSNFDVVMSDMSPNLSGIKVADQFSSIYLCELALDLALKLLKPNGVFLVKVFSGQGFDQYKKKMHAVFKNVAVRKPQASRSRSAEIYLYAKEKRGFC